MKKAVILLFVFPGIVSATDIKFENNSKDTLVIAVACNKGAEISFGWYKVKPNETWSKSVSDEFEVCLRVMKNDKEIVFDFKDFLYFPVNEERFAVSRPDDDSTRIFKWGAKLEKEETIKKDEKLPDGWSDEKFFVVGTGRHRFKVND
jgi:hypothetical protein